jgi:hypothetical protein
MEGMLLIFIDLKDPWSGLKPANLGSIGKHANHYTKKGDEMYITNTRTLFCLFIHSLNQVGLLGDVIVPHV